jgi:hypothetical protein
MWARVKGKTGNDLLKLPFNRVAPSYVTTTEQVGPAMIKVARDGHPKPVLKAKTSQPFSCHDGSPKGRRFARST